MNIVTTGGWADALEPIIKKQFALGFKSIPQERDLFFDVQKSTKSAETMLSIGDVGTLGPFQGELDYDDVRQNFTKAITAVEYARGLAIQKKLLLTDQIRIIKKLPQLLGQAAKRRLLSDSYSLFNNAFNTTNTGGDGLALCSTAHTSNVGGANQSNSGTSALSAPNVDATRVNMHKFNTNTDNVQFATAPDTIVVPVDLESYAEEIVGSKGKVDSANNNINFHFGRYNVIASRMLTDTNNWFMVNSELMKDHQVWFNVVDMEMEKDTDFNTKVARWSVYTYYGFGFERWEHIFGQNVS